MKHLQNKLLISYIDSVIYECIVLLYLYILLGTLKWRIILCKFFTCPLKKDNISLRIAPKKYKYLKFLLSVRTVHQQMYE